MANLHSASNVQAPVGQLVASGGGSGGGTIPISMITNAELGLHSLPGAGQISTDAGIADGHPTTTTGLRYVSWQNLVANGWVNMQGNRPTAAAPNIQTGAGEAVMMNQSTPRWHNGTTNYWFNSIQNIRFITDSTIVIPEWYQSTAHVVSANHDMHMMVEEFGDMKHLSGSDTVQDGLPRTCAFGSGFKNRPVTFNRRKMRRMRLIIPSSGYFRGLWIDQNATIRATPNFPLVLALNGDSWTDDNASGSTWSSSAGYSWPTGSYQTLITSTMLSFHLGVPVFSTSQGGTGEENNNATSGGSASTYNGQRSSAMWTDSRVNHVNDNFGSQFYTEVAVGSWNDGAGGAMVAPYDQTYRDRLVARYDKQTARNVVNGRSANDWRAITVSVQPVANSTEGSTNISIKDQQSTGQAAVPALRSTVCLGHVPIRFANQMWVDRSDNGSRTPYILADKLHLNVSGQDMLAGYIAQVIRTFNIGLDYTLKTANGTVLST